MKKNCDCKRFFFLPPLLLGDLYKNCETLFLLCFFHGPNRSIHCGPSSLSVSSLRLKCLYLMAMIDEIIYTQMSMDVVGDFSFPPSAIVDTGGGGPFADFSRVSSPPLIISRRGCRRVDRRGGGPGE